MKLVNVTNSHSRLVRQQLEHTDAVLVKVYTAGDISIVYTEAPTHNELLLVNKKRAIRSEEITEIKEHFLKKLSPDSYNEEDITEIDNDDDAIVEISIPKIISEAP
ncbi:DUF1827 family protein [Tetragenococcus halophilus]|uniref:Uncharacterized protein n=2 Tax=Tetragenococcus halophilus TaxID=51669 RepID=A0A2H6CP06_TETHA|nr:DUF1827 family protein [Tetragenococcus halophilus]AOF49248.1 ribose 5-phosphate isomerase [Tetragenococcus halophilus]MCF1602364.1 DUF1827 family protein [Tetragenococcus halophilus]MCF1676341.1 DUF1827 family protein [Tetragenococcus halophilus]MCO7026934.1 DUF1827 family protein [Tetragenococcus halophilus]MCO8284619.1 DUF1827 family protein [Tetragenococcus halophilus]